MKRFLIAAVFISLLITISTVGSQDESWKEKLGGDLKQTVKESERPTIFKMLSTENEEPINVIILTNDKSELKKHVDAQNEFSIIEGVSTELTLGDIEKIAKLPSTERILIDHPVTFFRLESMPLIRADTAASSYLVNGTNINISVLDTGISNISELQSPNRIIKEKCFINHGITLCPPNNASESGNSTDDEGHGTHAAGILAGDGDSGSGSGVATNSSLFAVKVLNASGSGLESDIIKGVEWSIDNGANIISMSLGLAYTSFTDCYNDVSLSLTVENATRLGVLVLVSTGNSGPGSSTTSAPACAKSALAVGSVKDGSSGATPIDGISSFSSRGPTNDNRTKPDLVAPGEWITSPVNTTHTSTFRGTSMAAPHVSGVAALVMQKYNSTFGYIPNPHLVKAVLLTAVNTTGMQADGYTQRNNAYGAGRIDAYEALRIMNFTKNSTISQNEMKVYYINVTNSSSRVTLYWPENSTVSNNLGLIVGNDTLNYTYPTDSRDNIEQVFIYNSTNSTWKIYVNGTTVTGFQAFYLASDRQFIDFITIESPLNRTYGASSLHFNMTITKIITNATVSVDNVNHTMINDTLFHYYNLTVPALSEGVHNATFYANDSNSFTTNTTYFTLDLTKPLILIQVPENGTYNSTNADLNFTLSEAGSWCGYSLDNSANTSLSNCANSTLTSLSEGSHNLTAYANDTVGNMNRSDARLFTVSLPVTYLGNGTNATSNVIGKFDSIKLFANWTDLEGLGHAWLWTNETGGSGQNYTGNYSSPIDINLTLGQTWSNFSWRNTTVNIGGVIAWRIYANDTTGKENSTSQSIFTIDNSPPIFNNSRNTSAIYNESVQINVSWYDNSVHAVLFESNFSNTPTNYTAANSGNEFYFTINSGNQTVNRFVVYRWYANDTSGLENSTEQISYTASKASTSARLFLNGTEGNRTYSKGTIANITAIVNITGKNITIVANFTNTTVVLSNGTSPQQNTTNTSNLNITVYNVTAYFLGDENYTASSVSYNMSILKADGDTCSVVSECFGGFCNSGVCANSAPPSPSQSSSSGGGGGGGGGAVVVQSIKVIATDENQAKITIPSISANAVQNIPINETYIVQKISLKPSVAVKNVEIKIERVPPPESLSHPPGRVFEYLKVDEINITNNQTAVVNITFKLSKTWISENNINTSTIFLARYTTQWDKLTTFQANETASDLIYTAVSPGLSIFAITGEQIKLENPEETETPEITTPIESLQPVEMKGRSNLLILLIITTVIAFGIVIYILVKNYEDWFRLYKKYSR